MQKGIEYQPVVGDFGHSNVKGIAQNQRLMYPSLVAQGPLIAEPNGVFGPGERLKSIDRMGLLTPWGEWYIGNAAKSSQRPPLSPFGRAKYADPEFLNLLLLGLLSQAALTGEQVVLITAVPGEFFRDEALKKHLQDRFKGPRTIKFLGSRKPEQVVIVADVHVKSEPGGLLFSHFLDTDGEINGNFSPDLQVVTVDVGEYTTCMAQSVGLKIREDIGIHTFTDISMNRVYQGVAGKITEATGKHLVAWQIRDVLVEGDGTIPLNQKGVIGRYDITGFYQAEVRRHQSMILSRISQTIEDHANVDLFLVGGGGGAVLGSILQDAYGSKVAITDQFATAQGLYNYGVRLCQANL